jgi:predicted DCC family thiol-disulfide oxidoreductase YuxK
MKTTKDEILIRSWELTGPWILYDGHCPLCRRGERIFGAMLRRRGFRLETLQSEVGCYFSGGTESEMKVVMGRGKTVGGVDGLLYISGFVWWAAPMRVLGKVSAVRALLERAYRWVAEHRGCDAACHVR